MPGGSKIKHTLLKKKLNPGPKCLCTILLKCCWSWC